jgi:hypothetical protein
VGGEIGKAPTIPFNIFTYARYHCVKIVGDEATLRASITSLGKSIKKSNILSIEKEKKMLVQSMCQPTSPNGLNLRFGNFCMQFFLSGVF